MARDVQRRTARRNEEYDSRTHPLEGTLQTHNANGGVLHCRIYSV
jgi:hypothetical protein